MPSKPAILPTTAEPVQSRAASSPNRIVRLQEDELNGPDPAERPDPHEECEHAPHEQVAAQVRRGRRASVGSVQARNDPDGDERQPEQAVRREGGRPERVALFYSMMPAMTWAMPP